MKGIVVETNHSKAVVLLDDGSFTTAKNKEYTIGQSIIFRKVTKSKIAILASAAAAVIALTSIGVIYTTPTSYVSLDVNPSVSFSLNRFNRVINTQFLNDDAKSALGNLNLNNEPIDEAVQQTINSLIQQGFLTGSDDDGIIIAASNSDQVSAQNLADNLKNKIQDIIAEKGKEAVVDAETVDKDQVREASNMGVTPGKLAYVKKMQEDYPDQNIDIHELVNKPVREINTVLKNIKAEKKEEKEEKAFTTTQKNENNQTVDGEKEQTTRTEEYKENKNNQQNNKQGNPDEKQQETKNSNGKINNNNNNDKSVEQADLNNNDYADTTTATTTTKAASSGNAHNEKAKHNRNSHY